MQFLDVFASFFALGDLVGEEEILLRSNDDQEMGVIGKRKLDEIGFIKERDMKHQISSSPFSYFLGLIGSLFALVFISLEFRQLTLAATGTDGKWSERIIVGTIFMLVVLWNLHFMGRVIYFTIENDLVKYHTLFRHQALDPREVSDIRHIWQSRCVMKIGGKKYHFIGSRELVKQLNEYVANRVIGVAMVASLLM